MGKLIDLKKFRGKNILLLTHENADLDAFCSTAIFFLYLKKNKISATIGVPSHINEQTLDFALKEKIPFVVNPDLNLFNLICIFDFNDYEQLGYLRKNFEKLKKEKCFSVISFDHHVKEKRSIASGFINPGAFSTTQILFDLLNKDFDEKMYFYTAIGILEDTGRFLVSSKSLFEKMSICLNKSKKNYSQVYAYARHIIPEGEKIAFLKAASRAQIKKINGFIVIFSNLNFYQGAAATKLLEFGAHISLVYGDDKTGITKLSLRAETSFKDKFDFDLMDDILIPLNKIIGGDVGGHSGAAQWSGKVDKKVLINTITKIIEKKLLKYKL